MMKSVNRKRQSETRLSVFLGGFSLCAQNIKAAGGVVSFHPLPTRSMKVFLQTPPPRSPLLNWLGVALLLSPLASERVQAQADAVSDIGSKLQLLLDPEVIDTMQAVELRLHHPVPQPLPKSTFKGNYVTVIKDGDLFRAYYRGNDPSYKGVIFEPGHRMVARRKVIGQPWVKAKKPVTKARCGRLAAPPHPISSTGVSRWR